MTLYHVICADHDGTEHGNDLFVRASSPKAAVKHWQEYYDADGELPERVDEITAQGKAGPIRWEAVPCVWVRPETAAPGQSLSEKIEAAGGGMCGKCGAAGMANTHAKDGCSANEDEDEDDCDCADRSWYGDEHDSACPVALRANARANPIGAALGHLRDARDLLRDAGARKAADKVRSALKSAEGAQRHANGKASR